MRITESRMMELASRSVSSARDRAGAAMAPLSSGYRVEKPSDDPAAWAANAKTKAALAGWNARGAALDSAKDRMGEAENALTAINDVLGKIRDLTVQHANGTANGADLSDASDAIRSLAGELRSLMSSRSSIDGEYLFAGERSDQNPFDAAGNYVGGNAARSVELAPGSSIEVSIPGTAFAGLFGTIEGIAVSLENGDSAAAGRALDTLDLGAAAISSARSKLGYGLGAIDDAATSRAALGETLMQIGARLVEADPMRAAADLAQAQTTFEAAGAVAQRVLSMLKTS